jgi:signal transduction histidine kinase
VDAAVQKLDSLTDQMDTTEGEEIENASKECHALTEQMHEAGEIVDIKRETLKSAVKSLTDFYSTIAE